MKEKKGKGCLITIILLFVGSFMLIFACVFCSMFKSCRDSQVRRRGIEAEQRVAFIQDSIKKQRTADSIEQAEKYLLFLDSLKIHNPDSFRVIFIAESLKIESIEQARIKDSIRQIFIQDSIVEAKRLDSIAEERRFRELKGKMNITHEEAIGVFWIKHNNSPRYVNSRDFMCYPYIGLKSSMNKWLMLTVGCNLSNWIFMEKITIKIDGVENNISLNNSDVNRDPTGRGVSEWVDLSDKEILIRQIPAASEVWIIYWGSHGRKSYKLTSADITVFKEIIEFFDMCGMSRFSSQLK